ncbi:MAG: hypothetical protein AUK48_14335 [Oscillatoriales cyanobacterium CG2_30_44_21]|nr:MAG: hypothetical protein AUK48_14335 [Oscillatoriales cyanobacterium CG2_30_44_21]
MVDKVEKPPASQVVKKDKPNESGTLNCFRETIKDVLEEITTLEVNTVIVRRISVNRFNATDFYEDLIEKLDYQTEQGLRKVKRSLLDRYKQIKDSEQKGIETPKLDLENFTCDLEKYKLAEKTFNEHKNYSRDSPELKRFERKQKCLQELSNKVSRLNIVKDEKGQIIAKAPTIRYFRKLWEFEQTILCEEDVYAQTIFQLDGDLTNRFVDDLFDPSRTKSAQLVLDIHQKALVNAESQWKSLIETCVNLVKYLIPYRVQ